MYKVKIINPLTENITYTLCKNATDIINTINTELFSGISIVTPAIVYSIMTRKSKVRVPYMELVVIYPKQRHESNPVKLEKDPEELEPNIVKL